MVANCTNRKYGESSQNFVESSKEKFITLFGADCEGQKEVAKIEPHLVVEAKFQSPYSRIPFYPLHLNTHHPY